MCVCVFVCCAIGGAAAAAATSVATSASVNSMQRKAARLVLFVLAFNTNSVLRLQNRGNDAARCKAH